MSSGTIIGLGLVAVGVWWFLSQDSSDAGTVTDLTGGTTTSTGSSSSSSTSSGSTSSSTGSGDGSGTTTGDDEEFCLFRYSDDFSPIDGNSYPPFFHLVYVDDVDKALPAPGYYVSCDKALKIGTTTTGHTGGHKHHHHHHHKPLHSSGGYHHGRGVTIHVSKVTAR